MRGPGSFLKKVLDLVIYGNYFISLCAALLVYESYILLNLPRSWFYPGIAFFSTLFTYNISRLAAYKDITKIDGSERHDWMVTHKKLMWASAVISLIYIAACAFSMPFNVLIFIAHLG